MRIRACQRKKEHKSWWEAERIPSSCFSCDLFWIIRLVVVTTNKNKKQKLWFYSFHDHGEQQVHRGGCNGEKMKNTTSNIYDLLSNGKQKYLDGGQVIKNHLLVVFFFAQSLLVFFFSQGLERVKLIRDWVKKKIHHNKIISSYKKIRVYKGAYQL